MQGSVGQIFQQRALVGLPRCVDDDEDDVCGQVGDAERTDLLIACARAGLVIQVRIEDEELGAGTSEAFVGFLNGPDDVAAAEITVLVGFESGQEVGLDLKPMVHAVIQPGPGTVQDAGAPLIVVLAELCGSGLELLQRQHFIPNGHPLECRTGGDGLFKRGDRELQGAVVLAVFIDDIVANAGGASGGEEGIGQDLHVIEVGGLDAMLLEFGTGDIFNDVDADGRICRAGLVSAEANDEEGVDDRVFHGVMVWVDGGKDDAN